jgi:hypothetical protein
MPGSCGGRGILLVRDDSIEQHDHRFEHRRAGRVAIRDANGVLQTVCLEHRSDRVRAVAAAGAGGILANVGRSRVVHRGGVAAGGGGRAAPRGEGCSCRRVVVPCCFADRCTVARVASALSWVGGGAALVEEVAPLHAGVHSLRRCPLQQTAECITCDNFKCDSHF